MTEHLHALPSGHRLHEYRIDRVLGSGNFGITYYAWDTYLEKPVAIKEYLPRNFAVRADATTVRPRSTSDAKDYQWGLERFRVEAENLARFEHPHINKVYRYFEANGTAYLELEYIAGETLWALLERKPRLEETQLRRLLKELLSGLEEVHKAGFVHRDVKPNNIILRADGSAVLLDFGAARQLLDQRSRSITKIFTDGYAPIEQYSGQVDGVGPWSDLYAFGMVAYRCISGLKDGDLPVSTERLRLAHKGEQALKPAAEIGRDLYSEDLLKAVDWSIEVNEDDRPQSVAALLKVVDWSNWVNENDPLQIGVGPEDDPGILLLEGFDATGKELRIMVPRQGASAEQGGYVIGRAAMLVDQVVEDARVSRRHARFIVEGVQCRIEDMNSTHGTWVNGRRLSVFEPVPVRPGDEVLLGTLEMRVSDGD